MLIALLLCVFVPDLSLVLVRLLEVQSFDFIIMKNDYNLFVYSLFPCFVAVPIRVKRILRK